VFWVLPKRGKDRGAQPLSRVALAELRQRPSLYHIKQRTTTDIDECHQASNSNEQSRKDLRRKESRRLLPRGRQRRPGWRTDSTPAGPCSGRTRASRTTTTRNPLSIISNTTPGGSRNHSLNHSTTASSNDSRAFSRVFLDTSRITSTIRPADTTSGRDSRPAAVPATIGGRWVSLRRSGLRPSWALSACKPCCVSPSKRELAPLCQGSHTV
jgi:hypothetical protein